MYVCVYDQERMYVCVYACIPCRTGFSNIPTCFIFRDKKTPLHLAASNSKASTVRYACVYESVYVCI